MIDACARRERPRGNRSAEKRDEVLPRLRSLLVPRRASGKCVPMATGTSKILLRSVVAGIVLAAALCTLLIAPGGKWTEQAGARGGKWTEQAGARDPPRTYRPRTPAEFFKQEVVRFQRVRIDPHGVIYADGHSLIFMGPCLSAATGSVPHPRGQNGLAGSAPSWSL